MKESVRTAAVAILGVLAVAFAAATLDSAVGGGVRRGGAPSGGGGESGAGGAPTVPTAGPPGEPTVTVPPELLAALALVAAIAVLGYTYRRRRDVFGVLVGAIVVFALLTLLIEFLPSQRVPMGSTAGGEGSGIDLPLGGSGSDGRTASPVALPLLFGLLVALAAAIFAVVRRRGQSAGDAATDEGEDEEGDAAAVGRAAGRAADRIEDDEGVENEVYRAWRELTALLDVESPETSTPGEFARAAVEAGLGREDVDELTRLFEDVRYGDREPSGVYEERAVAVFRRIERRYAEDEP
jgi:hypothetical protein